MPASKIEQNQEKNSQKAFWQEHTFDLIGLFLFILCVYASRFHSYLLFHTLAEIFSIVVAYGTFMVSWNSRRFLENHYLLFLGIAFLFIGIIDLAHTLTFKGMSIFQISQTSNASTQLWISARYMQSLVFLMIPLLINKKTLKPYTLLTIFMASTVFLFISIFIFQNFPDCYIEGEGLTFFKKVSEYIICFLLTFSIFLYYKKQEHFEPIFFSFIILSILFTIASELSFTLYLYVDEISNLLGHIWKIVAYYFVYKAIIQLGLQKPYDFLFRDLKKSEERLKKTEENYRELIEDIHDAIISLKEDGEILYISPAVKGFLHFTPEEMIGKKYMEFLHPGDMLDLKSQVEKLSSNKLEGEYRIKNKSGEYHWVHACFKPIIEGNKRIGFRGVIRDITEWKKMQDAVRKAENTQVLVQIAGAAAHEINQPLTAIAGFTEILLMRKTLDPYTRDKLEKIYNSSKTIDDIIKKMQNIHQYAIKSYPCGQKIVDFDESIKSN